MQSPPLPVQRALIARLPPRSLLLLLLLSVHSKAKAPGHARQNGGSLWRIDWQLVVASCGANGRSPLQLRHRRSDWLILEPPDLPTNGACQWHRGKQATTVRAREKVAMRFQRCWRMEARGCRMEEAFFLAAGKDLKGDFCLVKQQSIWHYKERKKSMQS